MSEIIGKYTSRGISEEQLSAILCYHPIVTIMAGPGSGKTGILCSHVKNLVTPTLARDPIAKTTQIIAIAFNRKAAMEIKYRLYQNDPTANWHLAQTHEAPFIGTHHAFLLWLVTRFKSVAGFPDSITKISFIDDKKAAEILDVCRQTVILQPNEATHDMFQTVDETFINTTAKVLYNQKTKAEGKISYQGLVDAVFQILNNQQAIAELHVNKYYLLIDEAQDLGTEEFQIYQQFPAIQKYILGDPAQAITPIPEGSSLLTKFNQMGNNKQITLSNNYRSFQTICTAAHQLIQNHNPKFPLTKQISARTAANPNAPMVMQWRCINQQDEMKQLVKLIKYYSEFQPKVFKYNQVAVLYRTINEGKHIKTVLEACNIPCQDEGNGDKENENCVRLARSTQIKGMEYPNILIPFFTTDNWPGDNDVNHSRRLLYTTITRAQNTIHFLYHESTHQDVIVYGATAQKKSKNDVSSFIDEINRPIPIVHFMTSDELAT